MLNRYPALAVVVVGLLFTLVGCSEKPTAPFASSATTVETHQHPSEGPHHGILVELGNEEYHAEVTHDASSVTVFILDSHAKLAVPVATAEITLNTLHDGIPAQYKLPATPEPSDPSGLSSRFALSDTELVHILDHQSAPIKMNIVIDNVSFSGEIHLDADHEHAHAH